jgi:PhnB protein
MQINPYLSFDGECQAAFKFYETCLGGRIGAMLTYGETPMAANMAPDLRGKIAHARLMVRDQLLMGGDAPPGRYEASKGMSVMLGIEGEAEAERVFQALAEGGTVTMPLQKTFWALRFGMLVDRFGTPWMINCER